MTDPKQKTLTFPFLLGESTVSEAEFSQPVGEGASFVQARNVRQRSQGQLPEKCPGVGTVDSLAAGVLSGGFVPTAIGESTAHVLLQPGAAHTRRYVGTSGANLQSPQSASFFPQTRWFPSQIEQSYTPAGDVTSTSPAVCQFNGLTFNATVRAITFGGATYGIYVTVTDSATGAVVITPQLCHTFNATTVPGVWIGLTAHTSFGVKLWFYENSTLNIRKRDLSVSGLTLTAGSAINIYQAGVANRAQVCTDGGTFAFLTTFTTGSAVNASLVRIDVSSNTIVTVALTNFVALDNTCGPGLAALTVAGVLYVAVSYNRAAATPVIAVWFGTGAAPTQVWQSNASIFTNAHCYCSFSLDSVGNNSVFAFSGNYGRGAFSAGSTNGTQIEYRGLTVATLTSTDVLPWHAVVGCSYWPKTSTNVHPLFLVQQFFGLVFSDVDLLLDPSVELYLGCDQEIACIARLGADTAFFYLGANEATMNSQTVSCTAAGRIALTYLEDTLGGGSSTVTARITALSLEDHQTRYALTAKGPAITAAGLPTQWDGNEFTEPCPMHQPAVRVIAAGGVGGALTGTYIYRALYRWKDSAGQVHRSAASQPFSITLAATAPVLAVSVPKVFRDGLKQASIEIIVYATLAGGVTFYEQAYTPTIITQYLAVFGSLPAPQAGLGNPVLYSTGAPGQELSAYCPPAFTDIALVNSRLWGLDAERPSRVWPSKQKQDGFAFEFHPDLTLTLPASEGRILAVADAGGYPLFLCERGIWVVAGPGPNNTGLPPNQFAEPMRISPLPCTSQASVLRTPVGVMFQSGDRFAVASVQGAQILPEEAITDTIVSAYVDTAHQEAVWLTDTGLSLAYSYALGSWRSWVFPAMTTAALVPETQDVLTYSEATGNVSRITTSTPSATLQASFTTGWILLGGDPQADCQVQEILIQAKRAAAHGLTLTMYADYDTTQATTRTWSAAEITALCATSDRYTLCFSPSGMSARAIQIIVTETGATGTAFQPIFGSVVCGILPGTLRAGVKRQGRK